MNDYRDGKFESLCNATIEHMNASSESSVNERLLEIGSEKQKDGHKLAIHLANAKNHREIDKCYQAVVEYEKNTKFSVITRKIASELCSNDDNITLIAQKEIDKSEENKSDLTEKKHEVKDFLMKMQR